MMSESEITSSFPARLPELSTSASASKLEQRKGNWCKTNISTLFFTRCGGIAFCTCDGRGLCLPICAPLPLQTYGGKRSEQRQSTSTQRESKVEEQSHGAALPYGRRGGADPGAAQWRGGQVGLVVRRVFSNRRGPWNEIRSAQLHTWGGSSIKEANVNTSSYDVRSRAAECVLVTLPVTPLFSPLSASESVLLKWLWWTCLPSAADCPVDWESAVGAPRVGALLRPPWPPPRLFLDGDSFTARGGEHEGGNDRYRQSSHTWDFYAVNTPSNCI